MEKKNQNGQNGVATSAQEEKEIIKKYKRDNRYKNVEVMYTYADGDVLCYTKRNAIGCRYQDFGKLYANNAEMDKLVPIIKVVVGDCGFEKSVILCNLKVY